MGGERACVACVDDAAGQFTARYRRVDARRNQHVVALLLRGDNVREALPRGKHGQLAQTLTRHHSDESLRSHVSIIVAVTHKIRYHDRSDSPISESAVGALKPGKKYDSTQNSIQLAAAAAP